MMYIYDTRHTILNPICAGNFFGCIKLKIGCMNDGHKIVLDLHVHSIFANPTLICTMLLMYP